MSNLESIALRTALVGVLLAIIFAIFAFLSERRIIVSAGGKSARQATTAKQLSTITLSARILTVLTLTFITLAIPRANRSGYFRFPTGPSLIYGITSMWRRYRSFRCISPPNDLSLNVTECYCWRASLISPNPAKWWKK